MPGDASRNLFAGVFACPVCRGRLQADDRGLTCGECRRMYEITDGIPVLLDQEHEAAHDELAHLVAHPHGHRRSQAKFYDDTSAAEFEITRPHSTPALYRWLLSEKLRRATRDIETLIPGRVVLIVCGGSGMDAEFYARMGARVISSDISIGAARRTAERARRFGLDITAIVADAERLPFADRSIDIVSVHDGLHHLEHPRRSLAEITRVASLAVSISEPADAAATAVAVKLGLALDREEAGNRVARMDRNKISAHLEKQGFKIVAASRYLMYYHHVPGRLTRILSRSPLLAAARAGVRFANVLMGQFGNKMVVVAIREGKDG